MKTLFALVTIIVVVMGWAVMCYGIWELGHWVPELEFFMHGLGVLTFGGGMTFAAWRWERAGEKIAERKRRELPRPCPECNDTRWNWYIGKPKEPCTQCNPDAAEGPARIYYQRYFPDDPRGSPTPPPPRSGPRPTPGPEKDDRSGIDPHEPRPVP